MESLAVLMVADGERLTLGCLVAAILARRTFPQARFHLAVPDDAPLPADLTADTLERLEITLLPFTPPRLRVQGRRYRILNKVRALAGFGEQPVLLCDSDLFFLRAIPLAYFSGRTLPAACPAHGRHAFPWQRLYGHVQLPVPTFQVLCGGGEASEPWFNAGLVYAPNGAALGTAWERLCVALHDLEWLPERWPYLDQIALPLAMARLSPGAHLTEAAVLDGRLNQNLFAWMKDQSHVTHGFGVHHHGRVSLIRRYFPRLTHWLQNDHPGLDGLLERYAAYERQPAVRLG